MIVYLVPAGDGRFDLEPAPADPSAEAPPRGFWGRRLARLRASWARAVEDAHAARPAGWVARWRARLIADLDESIDAQRSLWALRDRASATLVHPPELGSADVSTILKRLLADARRHHGRWLAVDLALFVASGLLTLIPGPNLVAYYFAFRVIGHYLSWRGARQALTGVSWTFEPRS